MIQIDLNAPTTARVIEWTKPMKVNLSPGKVVSGMGSSFAPTGAQLVERRANLLLANR